MSKDLTTLVQDQWKKANVLFVPPVTISKRRLEDKIELLFKKIQSCAQGRGKASERVKVVSILDKLFDIVQCSCQILVCSDINSHCPDPNKCNKKVHIVCTCPREQKIPTEELEWLKSQREKEGECSGMKMAGPDLIATKKYEKFLKNKEDKVNAEKRRSEKLEKTQLELKERRDQFESESECGELLETVPLEEKEDCITISSSNHSVREATTIAYEYLYSKIGDITTHVFKFLNLQPPKPKRNLMSVKHLAAESIRYDVSSAAAAAIASGFLKDLIEEGYINKDKSYLALDANKVRRARESVMMKSSRMEDSRAMEQNIQAVYFDGRKDNTRVMLMDENGVLHPRIVKEEHVSVSSEPDGKYLFHFTPEAATQGEKPAEMVAKGLSKGLEKLGATDTIQTIGGDSTNVNTGWKGGTITHLESLLGHKCHWSVCMLHTNELPLRHLIEKLDGKTCSNNGFTGPICKMLCKVTDLEINPEFEAISGGEELIPLPDEIVAGLSTDSLICYKYVKAIKSGILSNNLTQLKPGPINHSRWLTTGEALLFMWTRKHGFQGKELEILRTLVDFCVNFYFKMYFDIKVKHTLIYGPEHILTQLRLMRELPDHVKEIITPFIRTGAWHSHSECVLLSLLGSQSEDDRIFAVEKILSLRGEKEFGDTSVRPRRLPSLNTDATTLKNLISWESHNTFEPIYTCNLSQIELRSIIVNPFVVPKLSIHTQSTERVVKQVTEAAGAVSGQRSRDGFIRARLINRQEVPQFRTKKDIMGIFSTINT